MLAGKPMALIDSFAVVEREREVIDAGEPCPQVDEQCGGKDVGVTQDVLLGDVGCRTVEVISAAADLDAVDCAKGRGGEGIDGVVGEAPEEQVFIVES